MHLIVVCPTSVVFSFWGFRSGYCRELVTTLLLKPWYCSSVRGIVTNTGKTITLPHKTYKDFRWITARWIKEEISLSFDQFLSIGQHGHKTLYLLLGCCDMPGDLTGAFWFFLLFSIKYCEYFVISLLR